MDQLLLNYTIKYAFLCVKKCSCGKELHGIKSPSSAPHSLHGKPFPFHLASLNKSAGESQPPFPPDVRNLSPLKINKASEMFRLESPGRDGGKDARKNLWKRSLARLCRGDSAPRACSSGARRSWSQNLLNTHVCLCE